MDVTVPIPDKHLTKVADAYAPWGYVPLAEGTAAEKKDHLSAWLIARWHDELRTVIKERARHEAVVSVDTTMATEDPLA